MPNHRRRPGAALALAVVIALFATAGCGGPDDADVVDAVADLPAPTPSSDPTSEQTNPPTSVDAAPTSASTVEPTGTATAEPPPPTSTAEPTPAPTVVTRPAAPNGRTAPAVATSPEQLAAQITAAERGLADPDATMAERADWGHQHQVAIRKLGYEPEWDVEVFAALPPDLVDRTVLHVGARRALIDLSSGYDAADFIPAWEIVEPEPIDALLSHYRAAEEATGIEWEYLAAINLIETGMGRIRGLSSAGAQGPMQFLPTTWAEAGIGEGDIEDPGDAIAAAARYLVRRGGPSDMNGAIWGYNNSDNYVTAVQAYASVLRADPAAYDAIYHWEIYFFTEQGDVWLPTGFRTDEVVDLADFLVANPWSEPDAGLR